MPQETKTHGHEHPKLEGNVFRPKNFAELVDALDVAFDYRGDVSLELKDGRTVEGYLFNREHNTSVPLVKLFPKNQTGELTIHYNDIVSVAFSGEDTAFGRSWDAWMTKNAEQRKADAARAEADAAARGHL
jgi:hypothetical protein